MACIRMSLRSRVLDVDTVVNVVIPYDHFDREGRPKPFTRTLYLLHGLRQNADAWQRMSSAERFANYYGYALITKDKDGFDRFFAVQEEYIPEYDQRRRYWLQSPQYRENSLPGYAHREAHLRREAVVVSLIRSSVPFQARRGALR